MKYIHLRYYTHYVVYYERKERTGHKIGIVESKILKRYIEIYNNLYTSAKRDVQYRGFVV